MKKSIVFILLVISTCSFSQNGKIYPKKGDIKSVGSNTYVYEPPLGLTVPENALVNLFYAPFNNRIVSLIKKDINYEFTITVPDSIQFLIMTVTDQKKKIIDSNTEKGYVVYLKNRTKEELEKAKLSNLSNFGLTNYFLKLNITPDEILSQFDELYAQNPALKKDVSYSTYLYLQYHKDNSRFKPLVIEYAEQLIQKGDEKSLLTASGMYSSLKMNDKCIEIERIALNKYPIGEFAKNKFFKGYFSEKDKTEKFILDEMKEFINQFKDSSVNSKKQFLSDLAYISLKNEDTINIKKYISLINDKLLIARLYNEQAWELSGTDLTSPGKDLSFAENISRQSIEIIKDLMNHPSQDNDTYQLKLSYIGYSDTYALILYKQKKYEMAFQLQDEISRMDEINTDGKERYACYAEKAKGMEFAKEYIEKQIKSGVESTIMINQLQDIYKKLNLPLADFENIKENSLNLKKQKTKDQIVKKYGDSDAIDFTLTDNEGKKIKLSDYKGKVVVLDFWATWCGPCRASFPKMQELVKKYKDSQVEFFFIDVWEKMKPADINKNVGNLIKENNYTFHVLFDYNDEIVTKYKIESIPKKIVIDKNGKILTVESSMEDLSALIDQNI